MAKTMLIRCGWLITLAKGTGELRDAEVLVEGDRIAAVGRSLGAAADETIDARDRIVMPGLVNAHIHLWQAGLRGIGSEWISTDYHRYMHGNLATRFTARDTYLGNLYGALCQLDRGVTTALDWCHNLRDLEMAEAAVDGLEASGIRAVFAHGTAKPPTLPDGVPFTHIPHPRDRVEALRKGRLAGDDRLVTLALAILGPEFGTWDVTLADMTMARELGLLSSAHVWHGYNRSLGEGTVKDGYARLAARGLLGPDHNVVHGNYLGDDVLKVLVDNGVSVTSTVLTEIHGHGAEPLAARVRDLGAMPSIGIDTIPIVTDDMWAEMRGALVLIRYREHQNNRAGGGGPLPEIPVTSREALEWATVGGARALGLEGRIGQVAPGLKADLIMLGAHDLNLFPVHDPVYSVAEQAGCANVRDVMVGGEFRKRDGKLLYPADALRRLQMELAASAERIMAESDYRVAAH